MNKSESGFEWFELPNKSNVRVRAGTEGQRCYGGSTCVAPTQFRDSATGSSEEFQALVRESEEIVEELLSESQAA